jgi:Ni,Fe-hydrogenase III small subunit/NAD-dependent dihydropyrimidine dehydrogenase PreA subunit
MAKKNKKYNLYPLNTGSCNGCDIELGALFSSKYKLEKLGIEINENPKKADLIIITGPLTIKSKNFFKKALKSSRHIKGIIALGSCATSCNLFWDSYSILGPPDKFTKINLFILGCPPKPEAILEGIIRVLRLKAKKPKTVLPSGFRGRLKFDPQKCIGCLTCIRFCPAGTITACKTKEGLQMEYFYGRCTFCGMCAQHCPTGAIQLTSDYKMIEKDKKKFVTKGRVRKLK